jgi:CheY-like chemotaxis protein
VNFQVEYLHPGDFCSDLLEQGKPDRMARARIVVADNRSEVLEVMVNLLEIMNIEAVACKTAAEVLEVVAHDQVNAVITDVRMPVVDGMMLAEQLREFRPDLPVIMMSSYASKALESEARSRGAVGLVAKPFKITEITRLLETAGLDFAQIS